MSIFRIQVPLSLDPFLPPFLLPFSITLKTSSDSSPYILPFLPTLLNTTSFHSSPLPFRIQIHLSREIVIPSSFSSTAFHGPPYSSPLVLPFLSTSLNTTSQYSSPLLFPPIAVFRILIPLSQELFLSSSPLLLHKPFTVSLFISPLPLLRDGSQCPFTLRQIEKLQRTSLSHGFAFAPAV